MHLYEVNTVLDDEDGRAMQSPHFTYGTSITLFFKVYELQS